MKNKKVEGRTSLYNPLLQKPIALHPVGPGSYPAGYGGYSYIGPPPDFGGTYGKFQDTAGREQIGIKSSKMFSIHDGSPAQLQAELSPEERQSLLAQMDSAAEEHKCEHCRSELAISVGQKMDKVFCPHCGSEMDGAAERVKQCMSKIEEMRAMAKVQAKAGESQIELNQNLKPQAVKPVEGGGGPDLAKEAMKKDNPADLNKDLKPEAAKLNELKDAQKGIEQIKPMDELAKDMVKAKADEDAKKAKRERVRASIKAYRAKRLAKAKASSEIAPPAAPAAAELNPAAEVPAPAAAAPIPQIVAPAAAPAVANAPVPAPVAELAPAPLAPAAAPAAPAAVETQAALDEKAKLRRELRIMAALEPKKFAEVRKNEKLAAICAEVEGKIVSKSERIKVRAELAVLAAEDKDAHEELSKHLDFIAPEILMEERIEPPASEHMKPEDNKSAESEIKPEGEQELDEHGKPKLDAEGKPVMKKAGASAEPVAPAPAAPAPMAEGMQTEFLASLSSLKGERIEMSLYNEQAENPFWNVVVDGEPVGRVYLQDQPAEDPQTIRAAFTNDSYARNFGEAVRSVGLQKLLTITKAKLFSHRIDDAEITGRLRDKAKTEAKAEMETKLQTLRADFMKAMSLAMVASDKNFYQEEAGHVLKSSLWNAAVQAGLNEKGATWAIESGFEDSPAYFEFLMTKAQEIMDMPVEARTAIEKQILGSGKLEIKVEAPAEENLSQKLIKSSVNVMAMGGQVSGENRAAIRDQIKLSANRR